MSEAYYNEDIIIYDDENISFISDEERKEKEKSKRLEKILKRIYSNISNANGKSLDEIYKKNYFTFGSFFKDYLVYCKIFKIIFYIVLILLGVFSSMITFLNISIENSLYDLLITSGKIYFEVGNKNSTDYRPLKFHEYYYNQTYINALDLNINLISILNIIGNLLFKIWGFGISYFSFGLFTTISLLMLYNIEFDEKEILESSISLYDFLYILFAYIFLCFGTGCSSLLTQQKIIEYYSKYIETIRKEKALKLNSKVNINSLNSNSEVILTDEQSNEILNENSGNQKKSPKEKRVLFILIAFTTFYGYFGKAGIKTNNIYYQNILGLGKDSQKYFHDIVIGIISFIISIFFYNLMIIWFFTNDNICSCKCKNEEKNKDQFSIYHIFGYSIYSETIKNKKNEVGQCCECKCFKLLCESFKNCCDVVVCSSFNIFQKNEEKCECCCCCCIEPNEDNFEQDEITFCYVYKSERNIYWFNQFISNKVQKEMVPYVILYFLLRLSTIELNERYFNNIEPLYNVNVEDYMDVGLLLWILFLYVIIFIYIVYSISTITIYLNIKSLKISSLKSLLNGIFVIIAISCIFSLYLSLKDEDNKTNSILINNYIILIPLSMSRFLYLIISFYASRNIDIEGTNQTISSSILITIYISVEDFIIYLISSFSGENTLFYIQFITSILSLTICLVFIIIKIIYACMRKDVKFFIYILYTIIGLGPLSECLFKKGCDYKEEECVWICDCKCKCDCDEWFGF